MQQQQKRNSKPSHMSKSFKSLNQLRQLVKVNSGDQLDSNNFAEYDYQRDQKPHQTTCEDYEPVASQSENEEQNETGSPRSTFKQPPPMVVKNLVITNANLQNCNVFIQGSEGGILAQQMMASSQKSNSHMNQTPLEKQSQNLDSQSQQLQGLASIGSESLKNSAYQQKKLSKVESHAAAIRKGIKETKMLRETEQLLVFEPKLSPVARVNKSKLSKVGGDPMRIKKSVTVASAQATSINQTQYNTDIPATSYQAVTES